MLLTYHGHSTVKLEVDGYRVIIDPFISGNPCSDLDVADLSVDYILLTHGHNDHVGDTVALAKDQEVQVIAPVELADYLATQGCQTLGMNLGGSMDLPFGKIQLVPAWHSSSYTDAQGQVHPTGTAAGIILTIKDRVIYHAGDTALFSDLALYARRAGPIDLLFLPIGDHFTMGIEDAVYASNELIQPRLVVPVHYNTFPPIQQDPEAFSRQVEADCQILQAGDPVRNL